MISFATSARAFKSLAARHRQETYGGIPANGTADGGLNNFSIADSSLASGARKFRAAFIRFANRREIEIHGFVVDCHGAVTIPDALGLAPTLDTVLTYLPTSEQFRVCELGRRDALSAEQRYALRRLET